MDSLSQAKVQSRFLKLAQQRIVREIEMQRGEGDVAFPNGSEIAVGILVPLRRNSAEPVILPAGRVGALHHPLMIGPAALPCQACALQIGAGNVDIQKRACGQRALQDSSSQVRRRDRWAARCSAPLRVATAPRIVARTR